RGAAGERPAVRPRRVPAGGRRDGADPDRHRPPVDPQPSRARRRDGQAGGERLMELLLSLSMGALAGSGVWLLLRPRTYQVIMGLALLSYAVNLFIFSTGRLRVNAPPVIDKAAEIDPAAFADPVPQALV